MATDEELRKQGVVPRSSVPIPAPQAKANQALGSAAQGISSTVQGVGRGVQKVGNEVKSGGIGGLFDKAAQFLSDKGNAAISKSANTIKLGDRLTDAVPALGKKAPSMNIVDPIVAGGKGIAQGTKALGETFVQGVKQLPGDITEAADRYAGGAGARGIIDFVGSAKNRVMGDYAKNEVRTGRAKPNTKKKKTGEVAASPAPTSPKTATQAAQGDNSGVTTRVTADKKKKGTGKVLLTNTQGNVNGEIVGDLAGFKARQKANKKKMAGKPTVHKAGNMDVQFDPSVSMEAQQAFLRDPIGGATRMRSGPGFSPAFDGGPRVSGPNPYGANDVQEPQYVTRETHPNLTGEAATAINRAIASGHQNRLSLGVTGQNKLDQIGAQGLQTLQNTKQYGMNTLANTQLQGENALGLAGVNADARLLQEQAEGQQNLFLEQYKQQNADQFEYIEPKFDKKGNQLEGTGLHIPKDPYNLGNVDPQNMQMDQLVKLDYLKKQDFPYYEQLMMKYGLTP